MWMETAYTRLPSIDPVDLSTFDALYHQYHQAVYINIWKIEEMESIPIKIIKKLPKHITASSRRPNQKRFFLVTVEIR